MRVTSPRGVAALRSKLVSSEYPITETLFSLFCDSVKARKTKTPSTARLHWRSEIISEGLCDDVLKYLSPTLDQYRGASIIDINPGACIWSRKLHDYIKPKFHLLMEPDKTYYKPFIQPLLEAPGSRYTYTTLPGAHYKSYWGSYDKILDAASLLPPRPALAYDDPKLRQIDTRLLVVGNLWRRTEVMMHSRDVGLAPLVLQHMATSGLSNSIFHRAGLVRMLFWLPEADMLDIMASSAMTTAALPSSLEIGADMVQVAGTKSQEQHLYDTAYYTSRPFGLEGIGRTKSPEMTAALRTKHQVKREALTTTWTGQDKPIEGPNPHDTACTNFDELRALVSEFRQRLLTIKNFTRKVMSKDEAIALHQEIIYPQAIPAVLNSIFIGRLLGSAGRETRLIVCLDISLQLVHLEAELASLAEQHPNNPQLEAVTRLVRDCGDEFDRILNEKTPDQLRLLLDQVFDHLRTAYITRPLVARDARPFDPLKVEESETWPPHKMALVMLTPHALDLSIPGAMTRMEGTRTSQELVKQMYLWKTLPLPIVLDKIAPGAAKDLIPQVPAITDARKGGRLNPMNVKTKTLPAETLAELVVAFCDWPFRPSDLQLMLSTDAESVVEPEGERSEQGEQESATA